MTPAHSALPVQRRARGIAIASIITAPLSGWILTWGNWRTLFFIEGAFPFLIAAPLWWLVADRPSQAFWVSQDEREYIETSLARENAEAPRFAGYRSVFRSSVVWRLVLVYFFIQVGFYGLNLWLPHLVKTTIGGSYLVVGAVIAIPYLFALAGLWINARSADRTGRYSVHVMASLAIGAVALVLSVASGSIAALSVFLVSIAMAGALAYDGPFWASASRAVPVALAGGAMGLINALGNLGGFVGPPSADSCRTSAAAVSCRPRWCSRSRWCSAAWSCSPCAGRPTSPCSWPSRKPPRHRGQRPPRPTGPEFPTAGDGLVESKAASGQVVRHAGSADAR